MMDPDYDDMEMMEEEEPFYPEDPSMLVGDEMIGPDGALLPPGAEEPISEPGAEAPIPAAGPMPFPGGRRIYPASPFTPQPQYPQPGLPRPPGAGPDDGSGPSAPPP